MYTVPKDVVERFVAGWVADNVRPVPGLEDLMREVDRLSANLTGDARARGISGRDLNKAFGDLDDYLTGEYQKIQNPGIAAQAV